MARIGTIVHYKVAENVIRPAMVLQIHSPDCVQLQVFVDGKNDLTLGGVGPNAEECAAGLMWRTSVVRGDGIGKWEYHIMSNEVQPEDGAIKPADDPGEDKPAPESKPTGIYNK